MATKQKPLVQEHPTVVALAKAASHKGSAHSKARVAEIVPSKGGDYARILIAGKSVGWVAPRNKYARLDHVPTVARLAAAPASVRGSLTEDARGCIRVTTDNLKAVSAYVAWVAKTILAAAAEEEKTA